MSEGYLIVNCSKNNLTQVEILVKSIRYFDKSRPISIIGYETDLKKYLLYIDKELQIEPSNETADYFRFLLGTPYEKTIAFAPDQILTDFDPKVWKNLTTMNDVVIPKNRYSFNGEEIESSLYLHSNIEQKSFNESSILNAIFFSRSKVSKLIFEMAALIASNYDQNKFIDFFSKREKSSMPPLPEQLWPEWLMTMLYKVMNLKITKFDFVNCVDLSKRENSFVNENWSRKNWPEFLSHWVNDAGIIKIENFVQTGLIKYSTDAWLTDSTLVNLRKKYI